MQDLLLQIIGPKTLFVTWVISLLWCAMFRRSAIKPTLKLGLLGLALTGIYELSTQFCHRVPIANGACNRLLMQIPDAVNLATLVGWAGLALIWYKKPPSDQELVQDVSIKGTLAKWGNRFFRLLLVLLLFCIVVVVAGFVLVISTPRGH
jgi:ribose/xylose/arabinose/galactoside ABC-type transport system permease subunit